MSADYYRPEMTPPGYEGHTWPYRVTEYVDGEQRERIIHSPFPPYRHDPQGPLTDEFVAFQNWQSRNRKAEHRDWYCQDCGIRSAVAICPNPTCKSGRTVMLGKVPAVEVRHHCVSCGLDFLGLLLCGPCIGHRQADGRLRPAADPAKKSSTPRAHPMRRAAATSGARR